MKEKELPLYSAVTGHVIVMVQPEFLVHSSRPDDSHFVWAYHVTIENGGREPVTLLRRHWVIVDANGHKTEVQGDGVIGEQPMMMPGGNFRYSSGTPLTTPSGMMYGNYVMRNEYTEQEFTVSIPLFSLDSEFQKQVVH